MATKKATSATNGARANAKNGKNGAAKPEKGSEAYYVQKANRLLEQVWDSLHQDRNEDRNGEHLNGKS